MRGVLRNVLVQRMLPGMTDVGLQLWLSRKKSKSTTKIVIKATSREG
jgi:hypothetical protein